MDSKVLDEAVETYLQVECQAINGDDTEYLRCSDRDREIVRTALLASLPVLLGPRVGWMFGDLFFDPDAEADARHEAQWSESKIMAIYAPSLGEGHE